MKNIKWLVQAGCEHVTDFVINEQSWQCERRQSLVRSLLQKAEVTCQAFLTTRTEIQSLYECQPCSRMRTG